MAAGAASTRRGMPAGPWQARWPGGVLLVLLCLALYLPGLRRTPPVDRDESRFAQASAQMLASGSAEGWIVPRIGDRPRLNKPPLIYWLQAASARVLGGEARPEEPAAAGLPTGGVWRYRVPSVLSAIAAVLILWRLGLSMFPRDGRAALLGAAILASCVMVVWDARQARADQLLLAVTTGAMWALWECWKRSRSAEPGPGGRAPLLLCAALWAAVGAGIMSKGPVTPMVCGLAALALCAATGRWAWLRGLRPVLGAVILVLCVGPWVYAVASTVGWGAYLSVIGAEVLGRSVSPSEGHWGPPGYHLVLLAVMLWPGSLLTAAGVVLAWKRARSGAETEGRGRLGRLLAFGPRHPQEVFLLAWVVPSWIVFELVSTKLPHYTLPLYPALALISARCVTAAGSSREAAAALGLRGLGARAGLAVWLIIGAAVSAGVLFALVLWGGFAGPRSAMLTAGALAGAAAGALAVTARCALQDRWSLAQWMGIAAMVCGSWAVFGTALPRAAEVWVTPRIMQAIEPMDPRRDRPILDAAYGEDSLTFMTGARARRLSLDAMAADPAVVSGRAVIIVRWHEAPALCDLLGLRTRDAVRVRGINYSRGKRVDLAVLDSSGSGGAGPAPGAP